MINSSIHWDKQSTKLSCLQFCCPEPVCSQGRLANAHIWSCHCHFTLWNTAKPTLNKRWGLYSSAQLKGLGYTGLCLPCSLLSHHSLTSHLCACYSFQTKPFPPQDHIHSCSWNTCPLHKPICTLNSEHHTLTLDNTSSRQPSLEPKIRTGSPRAFSILVFLLSSCLLHCIWASQCVHWGVPSADSQDIFKFWNLDPESCWTSHGPLY